MSTSTSTAAVRKVKDRPRVDPPTCDLDADDMFESLTGFDEIAVRKAFDQTVTGLAQVDPLQFVRALVFVHERRTGSKDRDAFEAAQALTLGQASDYFADDPAEVDPEDPVTDQGKGDAGDARTPSS